MTFRQILHQSQKQLTDSPTPELDAKVLIKKAFSLDETRLFLKLDEEIPQNQEIETLHSYIRSRQEGKPIAYIIQEKEFYGRTFLVSPDVLIPRPETEYIVDYIQKFHPNPTSLLEIGTGSGCIAITLQCENPLTAITAVDISPTALQVATKNATMILGENKPKFLISDLLSQVNQKNWEIIVANLPYLDQKKHTDDSIIHEPDIALYADTEGTELYQKLFREIYSRHFYFKIALFEMLDYQAKELHEQVKNTYPTWTSEILPHPGGIVSFLKIIPTN